ncbi:MAG: EAL domain-containing protein [Acidimicrobiales bacterium]
MARIAQDPHQDQPRDERDTSGAITATMLSWVRKTCGPEAVERMLVLAGETRSASELEDETTWSTYLQATALLDAAVAVSGRADASRLMGEEMLVQVIGTEVGALLQSLGSPGELLRNVAASGAKFSTSLVMEASDVTDSSAVISARNLPGIPRKPQDCEFMVGILSVVPALFGLDRAVVAETECQVRGDDQCLYEVAWDPLSSAEADPARRIAHLESELCDLNKRFQSLQKMATELVSAGDVESVLALVTRRAGVAVRATRYLLAVELGGSLRIHSDGFTPQEADLLAGEIRAEDPDDHDGSRLIVDVASGNHHYGRLAAIYTEGSSFFPQERDLLAAYAGHAAAVLDTAAALDEIRRQNRTSAALLSLARALSEVASSDEVATKLAAAVSEVVDCENIWVLLWEEAESRLRLAASIDADPEVVRILSETGIRVEDTTEMARMLARQEPNFLDYWTADAYHRQLLSPNDRALAVVPISSRGTFFGVLAAGIDRPLKSIRSDADLLQRLTGIAHQAGTALENAALLDQVRHQALHDSLTGLPNRSLLNDRAERALVESRRARDRVALAFLDVDHFKKVNDTLGHRGGDELLVQVADRLIGALRSSDTVVRLGGDEFVVLIPHVREAAEALAIADKVNLALAVPFQVGDQEIFVTASTGIAISPPSGGDYELLLKQADMAMYRAKAMGGAQAQLFEQSRDEPACDRLALETELHRALADNQLRVLYQTQIDLATDQVVGAEALVRWEHPRHGLLEPLAFLPVAEESDLIVDIDLWVLDQATEQAVNWTSRLGNDVWVAVNLSSRTANSPRLSAAVVTALKRSGLSPSLLELEITETVVDRGSNFLCAIVARLRALGVRVAIDDFGTGSSSFGRVHGIQVDTLKIDRGLLADLTMNPQAAPLLAAMLNMGSALGLRVVAEGVEMRAQADWLRDNGCALAQGFLFSRPTAPDEIEAMVMALSSYSAGGRRAPALVAKRRRTMPASR